MAKPLFSKSVRKHIRGEKARIRREVSDSAKKQELIKKLLEEFLPKKEKKPTLPSEAQKKSKAELASAAKEK